MKDAMLIEIYREYLRRFLGKIDEWLDLLKICEKKYAALVAIILFHRRVGQPFLENSAPLF